MRLDLLINLWNVDRSRTHSEMLDDAREQVIAAEEAGFATVWIGEHHFDGEGLDVIPNPVLMAADLASRTSRIRLGLGAVSLPLWHPLRVAEDVATLDQMSEGRVDCAFSRSRLPREVLNLNPDADRSDAEKSEALFVEYIDIVKRAWVTDAFTFKGRFHSFPAPGVKDHTATWYPRDPQWRSEDGEHIALAVYPRPYQSPHPPLWNVTESPSGIDLAAANDLRPITWLPYGRRFAALQERYWEALGERADRDDLTQRVGLLRQCLVAETEEDARRIGEPVAEAMGADMTASRGREMFLDLGEELSDVEKSMGWYDFLVDRGLLIAGTPDTVIERLRRLRDDSGVHQVLCWMSSYGAAHDDVMRSLRLFGAHVVPELGDPVAA